MKISSANSLFFFFITKGFLLSPFYLQLRMKCLRLWQSDPNATQKPTFRRPSYQLHQTVSLDPTASSTTATTATIVLDVLRRNFFSVRGLRDAGCWRCGQGGRCRSAGGKAGGSGERQREGGRCPARHALDAFVLQLLQVKLDDFFPLQGKTNTVQSEPQGAF